MVNLKAVTIMPGSTHQVRLVREALTFFDADIPLGSFNSKHSNECESYWHHKAYGNIEPSEGTEDAAQLILSLCDEYTSITCAIPNIIL